MTLAEKLSAYDEKYWDFSEYRNDAPLVRYPAVMVAPMQACILKEIINADPTTSTVLDPFCGSGTVLCEGQKLGLNVMGFDINPLAVLIATVQLEGIPEDCAVRSINAINTRLTMLNGNVKSYAFKNINNYLAEENDWLGLADYSQRKKVTRLKPHNVFGYVNFPEFDENEETLRISNERADFIQDLTFSKVMYLLKGVVMFMILNIDVADKNPKYKSQEHQTEADAEPTPHSNDGANTNDDAKQGEKGTKDNTGNTPAGDTSGNSTTATKTQAASDSSAYEPSGTYSPKKLTQKSLVFTKVEGQIIDALVDQDDLSNKIHDLVFELYKLDLQVHRHAYDLKIFFFKKL